MKGPKHKTEFTIDANSIKDTGELPIYHKGEFVYFLPKLGQVADVLY